MINKVTVHGFDRKLMSSLDLVGLMSSVSSISEREKG